MTEQVQIRQGDVIDRLQEMPDGSVHCVVTSPPYWGLRDYGVEGQIGLEPTPEAYVAKMVEVFREVRRVLRSDGCCFINLGDSYTSGGRSTRDPGRSTLHPAQPKGTPRHDIPPGLKPKDLIGIPWRVAFALQADGWWLRSDIIWSKPNPMPESVTDRPTKAHEYMFLLTKNSRYFYDADAVREAAIHAGRVVKASDPATAKNAQKGKYGATAEGFTKHDTLVQEGRNLRSVWTIATEAYPAAHFATFPRALVRPCIRAGTSEHGVCPECGAPWVRQVESGEPIQQHWAPGTQEKIDIAQGRHGDSSVFNTGHTTPKITTGWLPSCECGDFRPGNVADELVPATVLDPFSGSGTVGQVCIQERRNFIGIELNPEYCKLAEKRTKNVEIRIF